MGRVVLIVDPSASRRAAVAAHLAAVGVPFALAPDLFQGIAALGRADFGAVVTASGRLQGLRGLCRLARKRHPGIHLFVLADGTTTPEQVRTAVGLAVEVLPGNVAPEKLLGRVSAAMAGPAAIDFDVLNTAMVQIDVQMALDLEAAHAPPDDGDVFADAPAAPAPVAVAGPREDGPLLEGSLDEASGAALLMSLFAQDVTGRLELTGGKLAGVMVFLRGEPAWVALPDGDAGLFKRLVDTRNIHPALPRPAVAEGRLVPSLVETRHLEADAAARFMHELIRERVSLLTTQRTGSYRFTEEPAPALPLVKVNPFGIILETCRKSLTPDRLLVVGSEWERQYLIPGPALPSAAPKLASFARGADLARIIDGTTTVGSFYAHTGLDLLMGALVVMVLLETSLVTLADAPQAVGQVALSTAVSGR